MKSRVSRRHVVVLIGAFMPAIMMILALNTRGSTAPRTVHRQAVRQVIASRCRVADPGCNNGMEPRLHRDPLIHNLMTFAVLIADRV
jgi:hypothetical protein